MRKIIIGLLLLLSVGASAQWQQTGSKVRYVTGIGIPTKDTAAGVLADSSQILIRPADSSLYVKYKRTWLRVGGGGGSISGGGSFNYIPKFTSSSSIGNSLIYDDGSLIGIGTATPNTFLDVRGSATFKATSPRIFIDDNDNNGTASIWFRPQNASFNIRGAIDLISAGSGAAGEFRFSAGSTGGTGNAAHYMSFYTAALERMRIDVAGNVGIGTTSPWEALSIPFNSKLSFGSSTYPLSISRSSAGNLITTISDNYDVSNTRIDFVMRNGTANQNTPLSLLSSGNVGIGTTSPSALLQVDKSASAGLGGQIALKNSATSALNNSVEISFLTDAGASGTGTRNARIRAVNENVVNGSANMQFWTWNGSTDAERMRITSGGNALIGTTTDNGTDKLQVSGSVISTQYKLSALNTAPASATAAGTTGEIRIDANYIYICTATNTWKRVAIATW